MSRKAIIVIGMHRSGTSAISGMLAQMGVFMGEHLYGPQAGVNEKGFYENAALVEFNEELLDALEWSWDDPVADSINTFDMGAVAKLAQRGARFVKEAYGRSALWGAKDPRTSLLLPFWHPLFEQNNVEVCYILMLREPDQVVASLSKRDQFSHSKSLCLWLNYTLSSYWRCHDLNHLILTYSELLSDAKGCDEEIRFHFELPSRSADLDERSFVDPNMRNQTEFTIASQASDLYEIALLVYNALKAPVPDQNTLRDATERFLTFRQQQSEVFLEHLKAVKHDEVRYRNLFFEAYLSTWWKISTPMRKLERWMRRAR